jgi:hypothetical protein
MMIKRNTRPKWLGETYQDTTTKRNTLNHNNQKQHQDQEINNKRQECIGRSVAIGVFQAWKCT